MSRWLKRAVGLTLLVAVFCTVGGCVYGPGYYARPGVVYDDGYGGGGRGGYENDSDGYYDAGPAYYGSAYYGGGYYGGGYGGYGYGYPYYGGFWPSLSIGFWGGGYYRGGHYGHGGGGHGGWHGGGGHDGGHSSGGNSGGGHSHH
jgi:hypothetical protein